MLRIHFSDVDLAGTRVATMPHPALEVALSLAVVWSRSERHDLEHWRSRVSGRLPPSTRVLLERPWTTQCRSTLLNPGSAVGTPVLGGVLAATSAEVLSALRAYYRAAVEPFWPQILARVKTDLDTRTRIMLHGGCELLLSTLGPNVRWHARTLRLPCCSNRQMALGGRGLLLVPSYFCWRGPILVSGADATPMLAYPVRQGETLAEAGQQETRMSAERSLVALLGRTRAVILRAVRDGCNTSELSRRAGVSISTASEHACVLRDAGLISSHRRATRCCTA
jgi:DNA-binding transcriptional ArsR family regulator